LNISNVKFKIKKKEKVYLVGAGFNQVYEIYHKNIRSNKRFSIKDNKYIKLINNFDSYIDKKKLDELINFLKINGITLSNLEIEISIKNDELEKLSDDLKNTSIIKKIQADISQKMTYYYI
jgi:hypothetical protein